MIKAIIFDIDDTLINHTLAIEKGSKEFYEQFIKGKGFTLEEFQKIWKEEHNKYLEMYMKRIITFKEQRTLRLKGIFSRIGESITDRQADKYFNYYLKFYKKNWCLFSDVSLISFIEYKLGVVSDGDSEQQREKLKEKNIIDYFHSIVISGDLGISKPDSRIFNECLTQLKVDSNEALYIGDNYEKDFIGAVKSGLHACLIDRNIDKEIQYFENGYIINSLNHINNVIDSINEKEKGFVSV